jgi:hypothetical protein
MKRVIAASLFVLGCSFLLADEPREELKVIGSEPLRITYEFQTPGRPPVSCFSAGCARYYAPNASNSDGAVLRLLRSDASIVIVRCKAHGEAQRQRPGTGSGSADLSQPITHCMMPDSSYEIAAELSEREVTLTMFQPKPEGPGPITSETYSIVGVLRPTPGQQSALPVPAAAPTVEADSRLTQQPRIKLDTMTAPATASGRSADSETEKSKSRRQRRTTADDLQGSTELLTYLTHELMDPNRAEAKRRLAAMGAVHAALSPEAPVSTSLQQEPQGIASPAEQAPLPQGPVDTAVTAPAPASTIAVSEPKGLAPSPTEAPLAQGPVDTALAPSVAASTIAFSEPKALPVATTKAPLPQGRVDAGLAPVAPASTIALRTPKPVPFAPAQAPVPQASKVSVSVSVEAPAEPVPASPVQARVAATAPAVNSPAYVASLPVVSTPLPSAGDSSVAATVSPIRTQPAPSAPAPSAFQPKTTTPAAHTPPTPIQIAGALPAPSMAGTVIRGAEPAPALADPASDPVMENPRLRKVEQEIENLDFPVEELAAQWEMFEKECPEPTTDAMCLDAKTKIIESTQKVFESKIKLLDQKIAILETVPQNAIAQQETDESEDTREKMKVALDSFPKVLAHLNKVLNDLKHANDQ